MRRQTGLERHAGTSRPGKCGGRAWGELCGQSYPEELSRPCGTLDCGWDGDLEGELTTGGI